MSRTTARPPSRPLSPHLSVYRFGPHTYASVFHRGAGVAMATFGVGVFVWWLASLAIGPEAYASFYKWVVRAGEGETAARVVNILAMLAAIGMTWGFFQHLANGVRHLIMDIGANYEIRGNKRSALATMIFAPLATAAMWAYILLRGNLPGVLS